MDLPRLGDPRRLPHAGSVHPHFTVPGTASVVVSVLLVRRARMRYTTHPRETGGGAGQDIAGPARPGACPPAGGRRAPRRLRGARGWEGGRVTRCNPQHRDRTKGRKLVGIKDKISDSDGDSAGVPRRQPDGDPPVPPVEVPAPDASTGVDPGGDSIVTTEDLHDLLEAPNDAALVVEEGHARIVAEAGDVDAVPILSHADLTTMLDGAGADRSEATLEQVATGLDDAVRQQGI